MLVAGAQSDTSAMRYLLPEEVGRLVRIAIEENELYIFTHPELAIPARMRFEAIAKGYERLAGASPSSSRSCTRRSAARQSTATARHTTIAVTRPPSSNSPCAPRVSARTGKVETNATGST